MTNDLGRCALHLTFFAIVFVGLKCANGILYPYESEVRDVRSLDGIWNFKMTPSDDALMGHTESWHLKDLDQMDDVIPMPVPSSYNDITQNKTLRDHVGVVWYDRRFFVPRTWRGLRVWIRFSSVHYTAQVWINGHFAVNHEIGHLPFETDISDLVDFGRENRITVACDNTLMRDTVPQGSLSYQPNDEGMVLIQSYTFDFFNYAGIHRPVTLYTTQLTYIKDIYTTSEITSNDESTSESSSDFFSSFTEDIEDSSFPYGFPYRNSSYYQRNSYRSKPSVNRFSNTDNSVDLKVNVSVVNAETNGSRIVCDLVLFDASGKIQASGTAQCSKAMVPNVTEFYDRDQFDRDNLLDYFTIQNDTANQRKIISNLYHCATNLKILNARLWWPYLSNGDDCGYMHKLQVTVRSAETTKPNEKEPIDVYRLPIGFRKVSWSNTSLFINNQPVYLHGFGKHEDSDIRGKGLDLPLVVKDFNLIKWIGANSFRTSHYPYADEIMQMADRQGIMVIDECPSVDTEEFTSTLLEKHKASLTELIQRDKNHPSVIAWSVANEARTHFQAADSYFRDVVAHVKSMDKTRFVTAAIARSYQEDRSAKHMDVISFNRYNSWYQHPGRIDMILNNVVAEAQAWFEKHNKPVLMSEYGADTAPGLHTSPSYIWSEEYQVDVLSKHFEAFDQLRDEKFFVGEFVWNFADFKTEQIITRVGGNKKGLFTRERQPKQSAHHVRRRYFSLAHELNNATIPKDLFPFVNSKLFVHVP